MKRKTMLLFGLILTMSIIGSLDFDRSLADETVLDKNDFSECLWNCISQQYTDIAADGLTVQELSSIKQLSCSGSDFDSIEGINRLTSLQVLSLYGTSLNTVDLSNNTSIDVFTAAGNSSLYGVKLYHPNTTISISGSPLLYFDVNGTYDSNNSVVHITQASLTSYEEQSIACSGFNLSELGVTALNVSNVSGATLTNGKLIPNLFTKEYTYTYTSGNVSFTAAISTDAVTHDLADVDYAQYVDSEGSRALQVCKSCGLDENGFSYLGNSVDVADEINLKYQVAVDPSVTSGAFTLSSEAAGSSIETTEYTLASVTPVSNVYTVRSEVPAKEMTTDIQIKVSDGTVTSVYDGTSIKEYATKAIAVSTDEEEIALMNAMLKYGAAVQTYFGYNTSNLASSDTDYADVTFVSKYLETGSDDVDLKFAGSAMDVKSDLILRYYFLKGDNFTLADYSAWAIGGGLYSATQTGSTNAYSKSTRKLEEYGDQYLELSLHAYPQNLDNIYTLYLYDDDYTTVYDLEYSVFSYAAQVQKLAATNSKYNSLLNVMKALYEYNVAADAYTDDTHYPVVTTDPAVTVQ